MSCFKYGHKPHFSDAKIIGFCILYNCEQQKVCTPPCSHIQKRHATWGLDHALRAVNCASIATAHYFLFHERLLAVHDVKTWLETLQRLDIATNAYTAQGVDSQRFVN